MSRLSRGFVRPGQADYAGGLEMPPFAHVGGRRVKSAQVCITCAHPRYPVFMRAREGCGIGSTMRVESTIVDSGDARSLPIVDPPTPESAPRTLYTGWSF